MRWRVRSPHNQTICDYMPNQPMGSLVGRRAEHKERYIDGLRPSLTLQASLNSSLC